MSVWVLIYRFAWSMLAVLGLIALVGSFYPPTRQFYDLRQRKAQLEEEIRAQEAVLLELKHKEEQLLKDPRFVERIAREELGLSKPGETVFKFMTEEPTNARPSSP
jgi:cell division protein FtsB